MSSENLEVPILLISNGVLLPGTSLKIPIKSRANIAVIEKYVTRRMSYVAIGYKVSNEKIYEVVTLAVVEKVIGWTINNVMQYSIEVFGLHRARIQSLNLPLCKVVKYDEEPTVDLDSKSVEKLIQYSKTITSPQILSLEIQSAIDDQNYSRLVDICTSNLKNVGYTQLLEYLAQQDVEKRVALFDAWSKSLAIKTLDLHKKSEEIPEPSKPRKRVTKPMKNTVEQLEEKLENLDLPESIIDRVWSEMSRLKTLSQSQSEYNVLIGWLELVVALPWSISTSDHIDIEKAKIHLDQSHDAMMDAKQRVLEHLAVSQLNQGLCHGSDGLILCLAGPPGIGKTSIAKAIAESMGRKFERVSLGGCRDESDIRGHRRTYVAAMPGRIIEALKHAKTNNPVILLDEVDKLYAGNHGSPSAALLELLDPEQNSGFHDHYLNLPFDLSKVLFIATANDISKIEPALQDRLEIIEMSGYSIKEKLRICENHLIPRQLTKHCILPDYVELDRHAVLTMVEEYTMEAGVRQLERNVAAVCRHVALKLAEALNSDPGSDCLPEMELPIRISEADVHRILKTKQMRRIKIVEKMSPLPPGSCFGLSVSTNGGKVMPIEASKSAGGSGKVVTTGSLGEVLNESILVAKGWLAANSERLNIKDLNSWDIHVHLPAGSVNKDGPSAGTGIVCTLTSLAMNVPIRADSAITGEISLTGHVLPVGGIKEKILAAQREGLRRVVIPRSNLEDYEKLDDDVKNEMNIVLVDTIDDVINAMIKKPDIFAKL